MRGANEDGPTLSVRVTDREVVLSADPRSDLSTAVQFAMFSELVLRLYNIRCSKDLNVYLYPLAGRPTERLAVSELSADEVGSILSGLLEEFEGQVTHIRGISDKQWTALVDHATRRAPDYEQLPRL